MLVVVGGRGGLGNVHFASSVNQAPQVAQKGEPGVEKSIILELRLIADVGVIGYPNVGKSTLLAAASAAKPKVASYPFTTREPVLGVVEVGWGSMVLAEIPGLIDGAHLGRGLGHDFLRHVVRTKVLIHLLDGSSVSPSEDLVRVNTELGLFDSALAKKPQLVVINKIDLTPVRERQAKIMDDLEGVGVSPQFISAETGEGVTELMAAVVKMLERLSVAGGTREKVSRKIFHPRPRGAKVSVCWDGDTFVVVAPELERIVARVDISRPLVYSQVRRELDRLGVSQALKKAGAEPGAKVRCGGIEWDWH